MARSVCPWWLGYFLLNPLREKPAEVLQPYVLEGMTVLEPGPGMGFFTLELARRVGPSGRVVALDIQPKMLQRLKRRAARKGLLNRIDARLVAPDSMNLTDLVGNVDFVLAVAMVHEMFSAATFFTQVVRVLKPGGSLLLAEPRGHVKEAEFAEELNAAAQAGLETIDHPAIRRFHTALPQKEC